MFFLFTSLTTTLCAYDAFYSLAVEYVGLFHGPCALLHHLSDLFDHFGRNGLTFRHEPQDNLPLFEDDSAAQQQVLGQSIVLMEDINLKRNERAVTIDLLYNLLASTLRSNFMT